MRNDHEEKFGLASLIPLGGRKADKYDEVGVLSHDIPEGPRKSRDDPPLFSAHNFFFAIQIKISENKLYFSILTSPPQPHDQHNVSPEIR